MKVMDVLKRIKAGERVMVTLPSREGCQKKYSLADGTEVSHSQFLAICDFLTPDDVGLIEGTVPQSYKWAG